MLFIDIRFIHEHASLSVFALSTVGPTSQGYDYQEMLRVMVGRAVRPPDRGQNLLTMLIRLANNYLCMKSQPNGLFFKCKDFIPEKYTYLLGESLDTFLRGTSHAGFSLFNLAIEYPDIPAILIFMNSLE